MNEIKNTQKNNEIKYTEMIPAADVIEENEKAVVYFEVPGANAGTVEIQVEDSVLTMEAKSSLTRNGHPVLFKRSFALSDSVAIDKITAKTQDGLLTLTLPKSEHAKIHRITVE